jgi:hypothetical protein
MRRVGAIVLILTVTLAVVAMATTAVVIFLAPDLISPFYNIFADRTRFGVEIGSVVNPGRWLSLMALAIFSAPVGVALSIFVPRKRG